MTKGKIPKTQNILQVIKATVEIGDFFGQIHLCLTMNHNG